MNVVVGLTKLNDYTGSERYCLDLVKALRANGYEVEVFALYGSAELEADLEQLGASLCVFPRQLRLRPDRVVCMHPLATALLLRRVGRDIPALSLVLGVTAGEAPVSAGRIDRWVAISPYVARNLVEEEGLRAEDVVVVPNGIDLDRFSTPAPAAASKRVRVLWASTYIPLRRRALESLCAAVIRRPEAELTIVADLLPAGVVPEHERVHVVSKEREVAGLISAHDVVAGLGPGRILLEALALNRPALCLNIDGNGLYLDEHNIERTEFYREDWGGPIAPLLDPAVVAANANRRHVVEHRYDAAANLAQVVREVEQLGCRSSSPARYRLVTVRRLPSLVWNLALLPWLKVSGRAAAQPRVVGASR